MPVINPPISPSIPQAQNLWKKLRDNVTDVKILFVSDSTGSGTSGWPYQLTQWIAAKFPAYSVGFRPFRKSSYDDSYGQAITTQKLFTTAVPVGGWTLGENVVGGTSGAIGVYSGRYSKGLVFSSVTGTFVAGETVTGQSSTKTAVVKSAPGYQGWQAELAVQAGTGSNKLYVDAFIISGGAPSDIDGYFGELRKRIGHMYDLIIYNHGHNANFYNVDEAIAAHSWAIAQLKREQPYADMILVRQNQRYDGTDATSPDGTAYPSGGSTVTQNQLKTARNSFALLKLAQMYGCGVIDIFTPFNANPNAKTFFDWVPGGAPGLHPNTAGKAFELAIVKAAMAEDPTVLKNWPSTIPGVIDKPNLAPNPLFNNWTAGVPDGWKVSGTVTQDDFHYETGVQSAKCAVGAQLSLDISGIASHYRGRFLTIASRVWLSAGETATNAGLFYMYSRNDGNNSSTTVAAGNQATACAPQINGPQTDGWTWKIATLYIPPTPCTVHADMIVAAVGSVWIDRVIIVPDVIPCDVSIEAYLNTYTLPAAPVFWRKNTLTEDVSGYGSAITKTALTKAFAEADEAKNIALWCEIPDESTMARASTGGNPGKRCQIDISKLANGVTYTLTWDSTTSNSATLYHRRGSSTIATSSGSSLSIAYQTGDTVMVVFSPATNQSVSCLNNVAIAAA